MVLFDSVVLKDVVKSTCVRKCLVCAQKQRYESLITGDAPSPNTVLYTNNKQKNTHNIPPNSPYTTRPHTYLGGQQCLQIDPEILDVPGNSNSVCGVLAQVVVVREPIVYVLVRVCV